MRYQGILRLSSEMLTELLGITDDDVAIVPISSNATRGTIDIIVSAKETPIQLGGGNWLRLYRTSQGSELPIVTPITVAELEQEER